jgi:hypothetical protein
MKRLKYSEKAAHVVNAIAFSPHGKTFVSAGTDGTIILWDVSKLRAELPHVSLTLTNNELEELWKEFGKTDGRIAMWKMLSSTGNPASFLKTKLTAVPRVVEPDQLDRLVQKLDSGDYATREKTVRDLELLGDASGPGLERFLLAKPSAEGNRRAQALLDKLEVKHLKKPPLTEDEVRVIRSIETLERSGTPDARALLVELTKGEASSIFTRRAQDALFRVDLRLPKLEPN